MKIIMSGMALLSLILMVGCEVNQEETYGNLEQWDFNHYGNCVKKYMNGSTFEIPRVKLYGSGYCDLNCDDYTFNMNYTIGEDRAIPAEHIVLTSNDTDIDCDYVCYGIRLGWNC